MVKLERRLTALEEKMDIVLELLQELNSAKKPGRKPGRKPKAKAIVDEDHSADIAKMIESAGIETKEEVSENA
jgi:hypothetical protein